MGIDAFLLRAGLAGLGLALAAGPLGCFVVWRRMAYFGDATAHASVLGVALALASGLPLMLGVAVSAAAMALAVAAAFGRGHAADTAIGVAASAALAGGLVAAALLPGVRLDLQAVLFGDVLSVGWSDVATIWAGGGAVVSVLAWRWRPLLTATLSADLAAAEGISPVRERLVLTLTMAALVAVALKVVGALLVTAMLIVPAAAARPLTATPETMACTAVAIGAVAVVLGLAMSWQADTPAGPSIVVAAVGCFALSMAVGRVLAGARAVR